MFDAGFPDVGDAANKDTAVPSDAMDASVVDDGSCNPAAAFGTPTILAELADPNYDERFPRLSPDERTIYYAFGPPAGPFVLFSAARVASTGPFGKGAAIAGLTPASGSDNNITVSPDGLVALLSSNRTQGSVNPNVSQIWSTSRANTSAAFATPVWSNTAFGSQNGDYDPYFVPGAGGLFYSANVTLSNPAPHIRRGVFNAGGYSGASGPGFGTGNAVAEDRAPVVTPDELRIYFASNAGPDGGVQPGGRIWTSTRPSSAVAWLAPWIVAELAGFGTYPQPGWISADGCRLYLTSNKSGRDAIYLAKRGK